MRIRSFLLFLCGLLVASQSAAASKESAASIAPIVAAHSNMQEVSIDPSVPSDDNDLYGTNKKPRSTFKAGDNPVTDGYVASTVGPSPGVLHGENEGPPETLDDEDFGGQVALPEITMRARLSSSDVNRIVCKDDIKDVVFSKEKGVVVKYSGKNAFIKFKIKEDGEDYIYPKNPIELYVVCGESTYNLIAFPKNIPSQTIRLDSGKLAKIVKNNSLFHGQPLEKKLLTLTKMVLTDNIPDTFKLELPPTNTTPITIYKDIKVRLNRTFIVEGEGLEIRDFWLYPSIDVELSEKDFLLKEFSTSPLAVSFDRVKLKRGEVGKLIIVQPRSQEVVPSPLAGGDFDVK